MGLLILLVAFTMSLESKKTTLRVLEAKKESLFLCVQFLYDTSLKVSDKKELKTFQIRLETLEDTRVAFLDVVHRINELSLELNDKFVPTFKVTDSFDQLYCHIRAVARTVAETASSSSSSNANRVPPAPKVRLPKIDLPSFSGECLSEWPVFYETFKALVHDNPDLDSVNKLHYLLGKLSSKALSVCSGIPPIASNYATIWQSLIDRYEDKFALGNSYMRQILEFKATHGLEVFLDKFDAAVSGLKNLGLKDLQDFVFCYLALSRLDAEVVRLFEISRNKTEIPTYKEIVDFVKAQSKVLARDGQSRHASSHTSSKSKG